MACRVVFVFMMVVFSLVYAQSGFFPNREERRYPNPLGFAQNLFSYPRRVTDRLTGVLHVRPNGNPKYEYPFNSQPISNTDYYDTRPPYQNFPNQQFNGDQYTRPVNFPDSRPYEQPNFPDSRPYEQPNYGQYQNQPNQYPTGEYNQNPTGEQNQVFNPEQNYYNQPEIVYQKPPEIPEEFQIPNEENNENIPIEPSEVNFSGTEQNQDSPQQFPSHNESSDLPLLTPVPDAFTEPPKGFSQLPPGFAPNEHSSLPELTPVPEESTKLPELTPVPEASTKLPELTPVPEASTKLPELTPVPEASTKLPELTPVPEASTKLPELTPLPQGFESRYADGTPVFEDSCTTVDGGVGTCRVILNCESYVKILTEARSNPEALQVLRKAHCGFEGNNPKVCCPRAGFPTVPPAPTDATPAPTPEPKTSGPASFSDTFLKPPDCGVSNTSLPRVVGGVDAKLGLFPWMALLGYKNRAGTGWQCGGALISSHHVLTAAHCIHGHEQALYVVRLGELDTAREDDGATPVDVLIRKNIKHENYNRNAFTDDIGLLVLEQQVTFTNLIRPICIPFEDELRAMDFVNYNPIIAGWGDIEFKGPSATHLQALQLPVVTNEYCKQAYIQYKAQKIDERVLCAGFKKGGKDACQGDSGGPLMQPIWNTKTYRAYFYQIGVVSFGRKCAEPGFPGVYSRVTHFVPWLHKTLLENP